jgi:sulfoxide reductase catalytic subunit YedY
MIKILPSEITPEHVYLNRRKFMLGAGSIAAGALALAACGKSAPSASSSTSTSSQAAAAAKAPLLKDFPKATLDHAQPYASKDQDELGNKLNKYEDITNYNNYYEFTTDKEGVNPLSQGFKTTPWKVEVSGLVNNPKTYDVDDMIKKFTQEERIYRLRCVEAWSMVIPWIGFRIADLLKEVDPKSEAKFLKFTSVMRPEEMPGQQSPMLNWPYVEGLRIDEAMNPLAIFATGMYGKPLVPANGAPFRLITPWKYGFKGVKAIVKIELVDTMPTSAWMEAAPNEYGFYANVNPEVDHPRWSQATERRVGDLGHVPTLKFNGYEQEVASLYAGMDLKANF